MPCPIQTETAYCGYRCAQSVTQFRRITLKASSHLGNPALLRMIWKFRHKQFLEIAHTLSSPFSARSNVSRSYWYNCGSIGATRRRPVTVGQNSIERWSCTENWRSPGATHPQSGGEKEEKIFWKAMRRIVTFYMRSNKLWKPKMGYSPQSNLVNVWRSSEEYLGIDERICRILINSADTPLERLIRRQVEQRLSIKSKRK